jgi:NitT/TauT family transport system substrate-binding protein
MKYGGIRNDMGEAVMRRGWVLGAVALAMLVGRSAAADEKIVFATDWKAEAEHGGYYEAVAEGLYRKRGLDVTIHEGGPGIDNQQLIAAGAVTMAVGSNSFVPLNLLQAGAAVRAVMAGFQKDPQVLMAHQRDDIKTLADMRGKPIMIASGSATTFWLWLKAKFDFQDSQIRKYTFNMAPWLVDRNAIQQGYLSSEPFLVMKEGVTPKVFLLADYGYPSYASMVLVPQKMIDTKPEAVRAFVAATIEGWHDYLYGDNAAANALIRKANPDMTEDVIAFAIKTMKENHVVDGGDAATGGVGIMTDARWKEFYDVMVSQKVYPPNLDYTRVFTTAFLPKQP